MGSNLCATRELRAARGVVRGPRGGVTSITETSLLDGLSGGDQSVMYQTSPPTVKRAERRRAQTRGRGDDAVGVRAPFRPDQGLRKITAINWPVDRTRPGRSTEPDTAGCRRAPRAVARPESAASRSW